MKVGDSILVLAGNENYEAPLETINRIMFKLIQQAFAGEPESPNRTRAWFFCDELKNAGRLEALPALLNARSKGVRSVLGFQNLEGLYTTYASKDQAKEVADGPGTVTWLRITSNETKEWAEKRCGQLERYEKMTSQSPQGESLNENLVKRESVMASEFATLAEYNAGDVEGIHIIRSIGGPIQRTAHYKFPTVDPLDNFHPRDASEQELAGWTDEDERFFGIAQDEQPTEEQPEQQDPPPDEPDLGSLGRIKF